MAGTPVVNTGGDNIATGQVSVTTTATLIAPARLGRLSVTIINEGTTLVRLGAAGVTAGTGLMLAGSVGAAITLPSAAAIYGIVGTGTDTVSFVETF